MLISARKKDSGVSPTVDDLLAYIKNNVYGRRHQTLLVARKKYLLWRIRPQLLRMHAQTAVDATNVELLLLNYFLVLSVELMSS